MGNGEKYVTLVDKAIAAKDYGFARLMVVPLGIRLTNAKDTFLDICARHDDDTALRYLGYVAAVVEDAEFIRLCDDKGNISADKRKEKDEAQERVLVYIPELFMMLWRLLPPVQTKTEWNRDQDGSDVGQFKTEELAVPKVREAIVSRVAERWCGTSDKTEADVLWAFLLEAAGSRFPAQIIMVQEVVRKYTPPASRQERIVDALNILAAQRGGTSDLLRHQLIMAWWRNTGAQVQNAMIRIDGHLKGAAWDAMALVERIAKETGELARKAHILVGALEKDTSDDRWQHKAKIGRVRVLTGFPQPGTLELEVHITHWTREADDNWFHDAFALIRERARNWYEANGKPSTLLTVSEPGATEASPPRRTCECYF